MANIVFYAAAYRGDVYPYVPVASELSRRGHRVTYVVPREFHPDFAAEPFDCVHTGTDFSPMTLNLPENAEFVRRWGMKLSGVVLFRLYTCKLTVPFLELSYTTLRTAAEDINADLFVSHPGSATVARIVADAMDIPWVCGDLFPMTRPTAERPPPGIPNLGPEGNRAVWRSATGRITNPLTCHNRFIEFRRSIGLDDGPPSILGVMDSPHLNIGMASPHYVPPASDWPSTYQMAGFTHWAGPGSGQLGDDVQAFLDDGPPPVIVTLGTAAATANPEVFDAALDVLESRGERAIVLASTDALADELRRKIGNGPHAAWPFVPLQALLPRSKAIVHSGSHGTNGLGLAAGLPAVVVPSLFDQVWHGQRQQQLGTGILAKKPKQLAPAIDRILTDSSFTRNAVAFAELLADEDGVGKTADLVESMV